MTRPAWHDAALTIALEQVPITARRTSAGGADGRHASRLPGTGLEFAQYRGYQPGDDLRRVDWKLLARSDRFFVREADAETALTVRFLLDGSASMAHLEAGMAKFDAARQIVSALAASAARHGDTPALAILGASEVVVRPSRDRRQLERIVDALDRAQPSGTLGDHVDRTLAALGPGTEGMLVVVTDWHDPDDRLRPVLERSGLDTTMLVLRTPREQDLGYGRAVTLEDLETGDRVIVDGEVSRARAALLSERSVAAQRAGIDVVVVDPTAPMAGPLVSWLSARSGRR